MTHSLPEFYIGLMSGTSMDGVDGVLVRFDDSTAASPSLHVVSHHSCELTPALRQSLMALNQSGTDELHRAALAANDLTRLYAEVVHALLQSSGVAAQDVRAIGAHGQTVRHQPGLHDGVGYTLQINQPALLAELTHIDVVADFRSRDVAAGGQGAPLVPLFHQQVFGRANETVAILNIGGIANLSVLRGQAAPASVLGFDCGPGNVLLDLWCQQHTGQPYDAHGAWAASGHVLSALLTRMMQEPFFHSTPPKSTGRDLFHAQWLSAHLHHFADARPQDVQATLTALTAQTCAADVSRYASDARELLVCGGGALNDCLMTQLAQALPGVTVCSTQSRGLPPLQVEAAAFAWLARQCVTRQSGNLPSVSGARGPRTLGAIYPR